MATEDDLRRIALALPGTEERPGYGGRPSFKVQGRGFAGIWKDHASVRLAAVDVDELTELVTESWRAAAPDDLR